LCDGLGVDYESVKQPPAPDPVDERPEKRPREEETEEDDEEPKRGKPSMPFGLQGLPRASMYERSYMHRAPISHILVATLTDFVVTGSEDGVVKLWKKSEVGIDYVRGFQAHKGQILAAALSFNHQKLATVGADQTIKFFDLGSFDLIHLIECSFAASAIAWLESSARDVPRVAVAQADSSAIHVFRADGGSSTAAAGSAAAPLLADEEESLEASAPVDGERMRKEETKGPECVLTSHHFRPVALMAHSPALRYVVSADTAGVVELWSDEHPFGPVAPPKVGFRIKSSTSLFDLAKAKARPLAVAVAPSGAEFAIASSDDKIRVFDFRSGSVVRTIDNSLEAQLVGLDDDSGVDVERRVRTASTSPAERISIVFDQTGEFLLFPTAVGIKVWAWKTEQAATVLGLHETELRFCVFGLYQGAPKVHAAHRRNRVQGLVGDKSGSGREDPTVFAAAVGQPRFYCLSNREPGESPDVAAMDQDVLERDVMNEPAVAKHLAREAAIGAGAALGKTAAIRTTMGDIIVQLFGDLVPKTVENFCGLARSSYYDGLLIHRVIPKFMVQTGDPNGDGTGGESIWGGTFPDEFHPTLKHDRPGVLSMANAGKNTNGSQFFITTQPTPWLDNKHSVFGRVVRGLEVLYAIEKVPTGIGDRPLQPIKLLAVDIDPD
jgi:peptidylprolyl isomerase domain and WD repeat-containing protein 1